MGAKYYPRPPWKGLQKAARWQTGRELSKEWKLWELGFVTGCFNTVNIDSKICVRTHSAENYRPHLEATLLPQDACCYFPLWLGVNGTRQSPHRELKGWERARVSTPGCTSTAGRWSGQPLLSRFSIPGGWVLSSSKHPFFSLSPTTIL